MGAMRPTVLLFDIDGTLVTTGGAGRRSMDRAFEQLHGRRDACDSFSMSGMTDRAIVRKALEHHRRASPPRAPSTPSSTPTSPTSPRRCRGSMTATTVSTPACARPWTPPARAQGFAVGLGTGNVRAGRPREARARGHLRPASPSAASAATTRTASSSSATAPRAAPPSSASPLEACRVVVIGDTPKDVAAAKGIGAESASAWAPATSPPRPCSPAGADFAFPDFTAREALAALLDGR